MEYLIWLESRANWLPAVVSFLFLVRLWQAGELSGSKQIVFVVWFLMALAAQFFAPPGAIWIAGLVAQLVLAIVVVLNDRIAGIY